MMHFRIWITLILAAQGSIMLGQEIPLTPECVVRFATVAEGAEVLQAEDTFTQRLSRFDLQSRLNTREEVSSTDYRRSAAEDIQPWTDAFIATVRPAVEQLAARVGEWNLPLPEEILLVCTKGNSEAGAPHTRGNAIVLPEKRIVRRPEDMLRLLAHELFHIASRQSPQWRDQLYATIGFQPCDEVQLPAADQNRRITNPDAPIVQHYITVDVDGQSVDVAPVLFSSVAEFDPSHEKSFFAFLQVKFVQLEKQDGTWTPLLRDDGSFLGHPMGDLDGFMSQVGRNTKYLIHPEEILADNFSYLVTGKKVASPEVLTQIEALLVSN
ncbi:hypothetical protein [Rosistilla oblonga]|uniref:hypothetical protein n=1 Tax=Rosistilla oblonga TaxID=2527990 RepID=UPI003A987B53